MILNNKILKFRYLLQTLNSLNKISTFVQVGAHDGLMHDPLYFLLKKNKWSGIIIEPQIEMLNLFKKRYINRDNLIYANVAVHSKKKKIQLYTVKNPSNYSQTGWASFYHRHIPKKNKEIKVIDVKAMPLMAIIQKSKFKNIDLLQIDTEGFDYEVLNMFNFDLYKPFIIQYEHIHLSTKDYLKSIKLLENNGYYCIRGKNDTISIRKDIVSIKFISSYFFLRLSASLKSRLYIK